MNTAPWTEAGKICLKMFGSSQRRYITMCYVVLQEGNYVMVQSILSTNLNWTLKSIPSSQSLRPNDSSNNRGTDLYFYCDEKCRKTMTHLKLTKLHTCIAQNMIILSIWKAIICSGEWEYPVTLVFSNRHAFFLLFSFLFLLY